MVFKPFTIRNRTKIPDIHFELTEKIRTQIMVTLLKYIDNYTFGESMDEFFQWHGRPISEEYSRYNYREAVNEFLMSEKNPQIIFDFIEFCFNCYKEKRSNNRSSFTPLDEIQSRLNTWFKNSGYGYEIRFSEKYNEYYIEKVDSDFLKEEAIKPALSLLQKYSFEGALQEFEDAIKAQRRGDNPLAIKKANDSFESVMKSILDKRKISYNPNDTASVLINHLQKNGILDSTLLSFSNSLSHVLKSGLPTLRNKIPGSGHGQGKEIKKVEDSYSSFAIHMAGSLIVFLIQRYEEVEGI